MGGNGVVCQSNERGFCDQTNNPSMFVDVANPQTTTQHLCDDVVRDDVAILPFFFFSFSFIGHVLIDPSLAPHRHQ